MADSSNYRQAFERIDDANSQDPNVVFFDGKDQPAELIYSARMTAWLARIEPAASEALRLAVRCQHLRRWEIPRSSYPMTRPGYHQWRTRLAQFHAEQAASILRSVGYDPATVARVQSLIRKERFKTDAEAQMLEDVACLVFLELDYVDFARRHEDQKVIDILRKTWRKMSDRGHVTAMELAGTLPESQRRLIQRALSDAG
ncbi:MAG TPA: DUF4202 domain-containing protein [Tepidisphaeraceae bacterium]|jgi:hypothetical protein|nr:DUF4202 domain-containing protein [Tepidisphaeraceae bacterium]